MDFFNEPIDVLIYHSPCNDGHAAAALFKYVYPKDVTFIGLHPKDKLSVFDLVNKNVLLVDICFSAEAMTSAAIVARKILVLDHHISNKETMQHLNLPNLRCTFKMDYPGVWLMWDFLKPNEYPMPAAFRYIGLRDIWQHESDPNALYFTTAFVCPKSWPEWEPYIHGGAIVDDTINRGKIIYEYQQSVLQIMMQQVEYSTWRTYRIAMVNCVYPWTSDIGHLMSLNEQERTVAVIWSKRSSEPYSVSLRSHDKVGPNVAKIAQEFGGGGHVHAAAFKSEIPPYELFKSKENFLVYMEQPKIWDMEVESKYFDALANGTKTVEGRKNRPDGWGRVKRGDHLRVKRKDGTDTKIFVVTARRIYPTVKQYLRAETLEKTLPGVTSIEEGIEIYSKFWTYEEIRQYGVIAIEICIFNA